jgi:hypothetical protein
MSRCAGQTGEISAGDKARLRLLERHKGGPPSPPRPQPVTTPGNGRTHQNRLNDDEGWISLRKSVGIAVPEWTI